MADELRIEISLDLALAIHRALKECAEDLAVELESRYPPETVDRYPSEARRFARDMEPVRRAMRCFEQLDAHPAIRQAVSRNG